MAAIIRTSEFSKKIVAGNFLRIFPFSVSVYRKDCPRMREIDIVKNICVRRMAGAGLIGLSYKTRFPVIGTEPGNGVNKTFFIKKDDLVPG